MKILIGMLNDGRRYNHYKYFTKYLEQSKYKDNFQIIILSNIYNSEFIKPRLNIEFIQTGSEYMDKIHAFIKYAKEHNYKYCFKVDNDVLLPTYVFDYIYENISVLDNKDNGILLPCLTTSLPGFYYFLEDFCNNEIKDKLIIFFKKYEYTNEWSVLNSSLPKEWSLQEYNSFIQNMKEPHGGNYKAIHPLRFYGDSTKEFNKYVLANKIYFFHKNKDCYIYNDTLKTYFMPQNFLIHIDLFEKVLDPSLAFDCYDEVTLNRIMKIHNKNILYIRNCYGIHISHNGFISNFLEYEEEFLEKFFQSD
jgi:hypothetical protein